MPVDFRAQSGQVLAQPIGNFYQGKALRADIGLREAKTEQIKEQTRLMPEESERAQKKLENEIQKRVQAAKEFIHKLGKERMEITYRAFRAGGRMLREDPENIEGAHAATREVFRQSGIDPDTALGDENPSPEQYGIVLAGDDEWAKEIGGGGEDGLMKLTPGTQLYDPDSREVVHSTPFKPTIRDEKISALRRLETPEDKIIDLVDQYYDVTSSVDRFGNVTVTNKRTGETEQLSAREARAAGLMIPEKGEQIDATPTWTGPKWAKPVAAIAPAKNLDGSVIAQRQSSIQSLDMAIINGTRVVGQDFMDATGMANITQRGLDAMVQMMSFNIAPLFFTEEADAKAKVDQFNQAVREGLMTSDRGAVWEQQLVQRNILPDPGGLTANPEREAIKFSRVMQWLKQNRENEVAFLEGRTPEPIPRAPVGIEDDPVIVSSEEEAESYQPGTYVLLNGEIFEVVDDAP